MYEVSNKNSFTDKHLGTDRSRLIQGHLHACANCAMSRIVGSDPIAPPNRIKVVNRPKFEYGPPASELKLENELRREFDSTGGPWGYRLKWALGGGIDLYIEAGTFSDQPDPQFKGTIRDQNIYVGQNVEGETIITRHNWFNQGAHYRAFSSNYVTYPRVAVVDYYNLYGSTKVLPELTIGLGGVVDIASLLPLLSLCAVEANQYLRRSLLALLSGCAVSDAQRSVLATALGLEAGATKILIDHGVLLDAYVGKFTPEDYAVIGATLALLPEPVKDVLSLIGKKTGSCLDL